MEVNLTISILEDLTDQSGVAAGYAQTGAVEDSFTAGFNWADITVDNQSNKVTAIDGTNILEGLIELRISYASGVNPEQTVAYGRGTTSEDKVNGDITIGFHEHCHLNDWWNYLRSAKLPLDFKGKKEMLATDYAQKQTDLENKFEEFITAGDTLTVAQTDEVGKPTRSEYLAQ